MNKQAIVKDIESKFPRTGLLSVTEIATYRGEDRGTTRQFLKGLEYTGVPTKKKYFVGDIAEKIMAERVKC